jgi:hypothetical protein
LTLISRFIEHLALSTGTGQLHTAFQRLSLLDDEYGTKTLYEWLGKSDVETHVYGVADDPTVVSDLNLSVHSDNTAPYRRSWVLAFRAAEGTTVGDRLPTHVAMVAIQTGSNVPRPLDVRLCSGEPGSRVHRRGVLNRVLRPTPGNLLHDRDAPSILHGNQ